MRAPDEFQLNQMYDILVSKLVSRKVNVKCLQRDPVQINVNDARTNSEGAPRNRNPSSEETGQNSQAGKDKGPSSHPRRQA